MRSSARIASVLALLACVACEGLPPHPGRSNPDRTVLLPAAGLEELQPADVAVAPLRNQSPDRGVPLERLRDAFHAGLIDRLYSPLDLGFVDAHWQEASFTGAAPPDALLVVSITRWDTSDLRSQGILTAGAELRLYGGGSPEGPLLWGAQVDRRLDLGLAKGQTGLLRELVPAGIRAFAAAALEVLPARDPTRVQR